MHFLPESSVETEGQEMQQTEREGEEEEEEEEVEHDVVEGTWRHRRSGLEQVTVICSPGKSRSREERTEKSPQRRTAEAEVGDDLIGERGGSTS